MTLLEAAREKGIKILTEENGDQYAKGCPCMHGLETKEETRRSCLEMGCVECYAREYKGTPIEENKEATCDLDYRAEYQRLRDIVTMQTAEMEHLRLRCEEAERKSVFLSGAIRTVEAIFGKNIINE